MYRLYYIPGGASMVVHWLLLECGAPFELVQVDAAAGAHKTPQYLQMNPNGMVPLLLVDGRPVYEAAALALLLAERHPEAGLAPMPGSVAREAYLQWMLHLANTLQPAFRRWFYPHEVAGGDAQAAVKDAAAHAVSAAFARLEAQLASGGPYLCGDVGPTAADYYLVMLARWSRLLPTPALVFPSLAAHIARMTSRPSFARLTAAEGLTGWP